MVVCAFSSRRLEQTLRCVESVLAQRPAPEQLILVVDHNEDLRAQLRSRLPAGVEIVSNPEEPGLSSARNAAVRLCRGDPIVFIDDDAVAHEGWLEQLLSAFEDPAVLGAGGHAVPTWENGQPSWFPDELLWVVGCSYTGLAKSGPVRNPLGCNMAFRSEVFERVGLFDTSIGRVGSRPTGCEETEFCIRLKRALPDAQLVLVAGAEIDHAVRQERGRLRYLLRRCYLEGISKALVRKLWDTTSLAPERAYVRRTLPLRFALNARTALVGPARIAALGQVGAVIGGLAAAAAGYVSGAVALRRGAWGSRGSHQQAPYRGSSRCAET